MQTTVVEFIVKRDVSCLEFVVLSGLFCYVECKENVINVMDWLSRFGRLELCTLLQYISVL